MSLRTIMIFPDFENMEIIDNIRSQFDPLAKLVRPHITLVFPFESQISNEELAQILNLRCMSIKPFAITLKGISKQHDAFGHYLFLNVVQGADIIRFIHQILYDNEFKKHNLGLQYTPHLTVGKLPSAISLNDAYNKIKTMDSTFSTIVNKISVEMIGDNDESIIVIEKELN